MSVALESKRLLGSTQEMDRVSGIAFEKVERMIEALDRLRRSIETRLTALENEPSALASVIHQAVSLGAGANNIAAATAPRVGALLYVILTNTVAAPGAVTWSSDFMNGPAVPQGNGKVHVVLFCGTATKWRMVATQVGQS